jgi:hypothetical protein
MWSIRSVLNDDAADDAVHLVPLADQELGEVADPS